ncbi:MAG: hypothetical protein R3336_09705, partial [Phycisphaeraceae bacterium]|nr:hypothetical protein [Phycisphaeraceae bacterium]
LAENGRGSISIILKTLDARTLGALIALYERAVGIYAELIRINAYHQPGVEAGKKAAAAVLKLQRRAVEHLRDSGDTLTCGQLAEALDAPDRAETLHHLLEHLAVNRRGVTSDGDGYRWSETD